MTVQEQLAQVRANVPRVHQSGVSAGYAQRENEWQLQYLDNGAREDYTSAFAGGSWNVDSFRPSMDMVPKDSYYMFHYHNCGFWGMVGNSLSEEERAKMESIRYDLVEKLAECGVTLDFSQCRLMKKTFYGANISHVGVIDFANVKTFWVDRYETVDKYSFTNQAYFEGGIENWRSMFYGSWITKIDKLIFYATNPSFNRHWMPPSIVDVTVEGVIAGNGLNLSYCADITHDSIMQFINALEDKTDGHDIGYETWKIYLGADNYAKLTAAEIAIATDKGWVVSNGEPAYRDPIYP